MLAISTYINQINQLCKQNRVKELYVFGSALSDSYRDNSDIDLLVDFQQLSPSDYARNYFELKFALEKLFARDIDLLEARSLRNPFLSQEIDKKKKLVYAT